MTTRRGFLKLLGIAPVAPLALKLQTVMAEIQEPTVEKIVNYVEDQIVLVEKKIITDTVFLEEVGSYAWQGDNISYQMIDGSVHHRKVGFGQVEIEHKVNPALDECMNSSDEYCFSFVSGRHERVTLSGYLTGLRVQFRGPDFIRQQSTISLSSEPIVLTT